MATPNYTISLAANQVGASSVSPGQCLVLDPTGTFYQLSNSTNRGTRKSSGISLGTAPAYGATLMQTVGDCPTSVTGLAAGTASPLRVSTAGVLERIASPSASDDVVGYCETDGTAHLLFGGIPSILGASVVTFAAVQTALAAADASISVNSQKITNLANGTASTDAAAFGQISWTTRWETDFADVVTYPSNTVFGSNGTYSITPSATGSAANFVVANYANSSKFQITSGTGFEITNNTTNSSYTTARTPPIVTSSFTQLYPAASFSQGFRVWARMTGTFVRATDQCRVGIESANGGTTENYGTSFYYVSGGKSAGRSSAVNSTYAGYGDGANIGSGPDVLMLEWFPGGFFKVFYGTWSAGWPAMSALTLISGSAHTAMGTPTPASYANRIKLIGDAQIFLSTESANATGGNAMVVKNLKLESFGAP